MWNHSSSAASYLQVTAMGLAGRDDVAVVGIAGELDAYSSLSLVDEVVARVGQRHEAVIVDLSGVMLASAAGVRALAALPAHLAETGRRVLFARCNPQVRDTIRHIGSALALEDHPSVAAALTAYRSAPVTPPAAQDERPTRLDVLRERARNLPGVLQTRPLIAGAATELTDRYGLDDSAVALELFRAGSQRFNIKVRALALAFVAAVPAPPSRAMWFTGRLRHTAPPISFAGRGGRWHSTRSSLLSIVLDTVMSTTNSAAGYVQLADEFLGGLRLEQHRGLPEQFSSLFAYVEGSETPCAAAHESGQQLVANLDELAGTGTDPALLATFREAGLRSIRSMPMPGHTGRCTGVVSVLHRGPRPAVCAADAAALDVIVRETGTWLDWHQRTIMLDALEDLHRRARLASNGQLAQR